MREKIIINIKTLYYKQNKKLIRFAEILNIKNKS